MKIISLKGLECYRCKNRWFPRLSKKKMPKYCPKCKSPYWGIRKRLKKQNQHKVISRSSKILNNLIKI